MHVGRRGAACYCWSMSTVATSNAPRQRTILLVDDDARLARVIALQLRLSGEWSLVGCAFDDEAALDLAGTHHPDLVLLDLWLHGVDSLALLAQLLTLTPPPLVVLLTAEADERWRERALAAGARAYLSKLELFDLPAALRDLQPA
jgi:CheY-like chemotaxis protein